MRILDQIYDKLHRNINIYLAAYKAGKIAGFDYTILRWKNHTKFLLRMHKQEDHRKELKRMTIFWDSFLDVIQPYINAPIYPSVIDDGKEAVIWVYWNDLTTMPLLVKKCIERIRQNSNHHKVVVVCEETVQNYLKLDEIIWRKYHEGKISKTHFSDIVRIALLYPYGGVWMDCTLLLTQPLPEFVTSSDFYTNRLAEADKHNICDGRWSTFFMACHKGNLMMQATLDVFVEYWKRYDYNVDYVWMDYIFNLVYNNITSVRRMIDSVPYNNPGIWLLQLRINQACSKKEYADIFNDKSRFIYKLSCKKSFGNSCYDKDGNITLLGRLCDKID